MSYSDWRARAGVGFVLGVVLIMAGLTVRDWQFWLIAVGGAVFYTVVLLRDE